MAKHIVFTGPDGSGKSSQLQKIVQLLLYNKRNVLTNRVIRYDELYDKMLPLIMEKLFEFIENDDRPNTFVFHDRWNYPEDVIYPSVMQGKITPLMQKKDEIEERINSLGNKVLFVVFNAPPGILMERLSDRGNEDYIKSSHLHELTLRYQQFVDETAIENLIYMYDDGDKHFNLINRNLMDAMVQKGIFK